MKRAIIVQGAPGVGKSTLAQRLKKDLEIKLVAKDDIKEFFYDSLGYPENKTESELYGRMAIRAMYVGVDEFIKAGQMVIIEGALVPEYAVKDLNPIVPMSELLQIHVYCDLKVNEKRFLERSKDGSRHLGHADVSIDPEIAQLRNNPIPGIHTLSVDTTNFSDDDYQGLLKKIQRIISQ